MNNEDSQIIGKQSGYGGTSAARTLGRSTRIAACRLANASRRQSFFSIAMPLFTPGGAPETTDGAMPGD